MTEHREREDKYDVSPDFVVPDLTADPSVDRVETQTHRLEALYFDTAEGHLRRRSITLRRRKGGTDPGWHLKLPAGSARTEIRVASRASSVPRTLSDLLLGVRRDQALVPTVGLSTTRRSHLLLDAQGLSLAEVADDTVHVSEQDGSPFAADWREVEVELGPAGDDNLLSTLGQRLVAAGATPSLSNSKSSRALGSEPDTAGPDVKGLAGIVDDYLQTQYEAIVDGDLALRREINAVHPTRVAVRRLRSTVRTFDALFEPEAAQRLEDELVWYAAILGSVRDLDVVRDRLTAKVAALPPELVLGPVAARLESSLASERATAYRRLRKALNGKRYLALIALLDQWRVAPPFIAAADSPKKQASTFVNRAEKSMLRRLHRATRPEADDALLHKARKAEKRYRYACELAQSTLGKQTEQAITRAKALQKLPGEFQDSVVSAAMLRRLAVQAGDIPGENGFTYGILLAQELATAARIRRQVVDDDS